MNNSTTSHRVYTPDSSLRHPLRLVADMFVDLVACRELAWRLTVRDITAQYRQAALGMLWAIIIPLANTAVWLFLNGSGLVRVGETMLPYPVFVFTGTMLWAIFMDAINAPLQITTASRAMLAKINFPREALIVSGLYQTLFNAVIKIALVIGAMMLMGIFPGWSLLLFPLGVLSLILAGTMLGLLITPVGLLFTDVGKSLPLVLQFLMYASPVVFPMPVEGMAATVLKLNPLTPLIVTTRDWLTGTPPEFLSYFLAVNAVVIALLFVVWAIYRLAMPILIERMNA